MNRGLLVVAMVATCGCDQVFGLDGPGTLPLQEVVAGATQAAGSPLVFPIQPTQAGSTLVLLAALRTSTIHIDAVTDDGGNPWTRVLDGPQGSATPVAARLEIWYAPATSPAAAITIEMASFRPIAVSLTEWAGLSATGTVIGKAMDRSDMSAEASSGTMTTQASGLLIGAVAMGDPVTSAVQPTEFSPLLPFSIDAAYDVVGAAAYRDAAAGSYAVTWAFSQPTVWTAGVVGFRRGD